MERFDKRRIRFVRVKWHDKSNRGYGQHVYFCTKNTTAL